MISTRVLLVLALVAMAALGADLALRTAQRGAATGVATTVLASRWNIDPQQVSQIRLTGAGVQASLLHRQGGEWQQVEPFVCGMNRDAIDRLVEVVLDLPIHDVLAADAAPGPLGLAAPSATIELQIDTTSYVLHLGRRSVGGRAYLAVDGEGVIGGQEVHRLLLDGDPRSWRDARLFPGADVEAQRLVRAIGDDRVVLARVEGTWRMEEPVRGRVNEDALDEWILRLASSRAGALVVDGEVDLDLLGLSDPAATVKVVDNAGETRTLLIGGRARAGLTDRFAMIEGRPWAFRMAWDDVTRLFPLPEALADPVASAAAASDVKRIRISAGDRSLVLRRDLDRWVDDDRGGAIVPRAQVDALLQWLLATPSTSVLISPWPRDRALAIVTLEGYDGRPMDSVRIAGEDDGSWVLENGDGVLRRHAPEAGEALTGLITIDH